MTGPAKGDATGVGGDFERQAGGSLDDKGERTGPERFGEPKEIVGQFAGEDGSVVEGVDEDRESAGFQAAFDAEDFVDGREINGIGGEGVKGIRGNGDNSAAIEPLRGIADGMGIGVFRA